MRQHLAGKAFVEQMVILTICRQDAGAPVNSQCKSRLSRDKMSYRADVQPPAFLLEICC